MLEVPLLDVVTGGPFPPHLAPACFLVATWYLAATLSVRVTPLLHELLPTGGGGSGSIGLGLRPGSSHSCHGRDCCYPFGFEAVPHNHCAGVSRPERGGAPLNRCFIVECLHWNQQLPAVFAGCWTGHVLEYPLPCSHRRPLSPIFLFTASTTQNCHSYWRPWLCRTSYSLHNRVKIEFQVDGCVSSHYFGSTPPAISSVFLPWLNIWYLMRDKKVYIDFWRKTSLFAKKYSNAPPEQVFCSFLKRYRFFRKKCLTWKYSASNLW